MSYCLNPVCTQPQNSDINFCQSCGAKLLLRERYRAVRQIGQGGFGKTFLAVDQDLPNKPSCVIKQFSPQVQSASVLQKATELFEQEAVQLNILGKHPQIPELLAHFEQDKRLYLVQEYVKGRNLAEELEKDGAFSEAKIRELLIGLLPVLQYIHDNQVIHRDIKPENIIRRNDGKLFFVDFGAVKIVTGSTLQKTGTTIGDPRYMPSEQLRGKVDFTSDLYALGVTCLHLLTDIEPINLFNNSENKWIWRDYLACAINPLLGIILDKMVEIAMNRRYQSASEILQTLGVNFSNQSVNSSHGSLVTSHQPAIQASLIPVRIGDKCGYEDNLGQVVTKLLFESATPFSEGLAAVKFNNKWGFIDNTGQFVINPNFDEASYFSNGLARIKTNGKFHFIDMAGQIVFTANFDAVGDFKDGLARVAIGHYQEWKATLELLYSTDKKQILVGKYGFIDIAGNIVIPLQFDAASDFNQGLARIGVASSYGLIDATGKIVVRPQFDYIYYIHKGQLTEELTLVLVNKKYGFIDIKTGKIIFKPQFDFIGNFYNELNEIRIDEKCGLINIKTRAILLKPQYDKLKLISLSLIGYKLNEKWGLINYRLGRITIVTEPQFFDIKSGAYPKVLVQGIFAKKWRRINAETGNFID
jgi:serine/threonine protein kinase